MFYKQKIKPPASIKAGPGSPQELIIRHQVLRRSSLSGTRFSAGAHYPAPGSPQELPASIKA